MKCWNETLLLSSLGFQQLHWSRREQGFVFQLHTPEKCWIRWDESQVLASIQSFRDIDSGYHQSAHGMILLLTSQVSNWSRGCSSSEFPSLIPAAFGAFFDSISPCSLCVYGGTWWELAEKAREFNTTRVSSWSHARNPPTRDYLLYLLRWVLILMLLPFNSLWKQLTKWAISFKSSIHEER